MNMTTRILALAALSVLALALGCGSEDKAAVARQVANQWVQDNTEEMIAEVIGAVRNAPAVSDQLDKLPSLLVGTATDLFEEIIDQQVREHLSIELSSPRRSSDERYVVTVTLGLQMEVDLPVVGQRSYSAEVPLDLTVDVEAREVERWTVDLSGVSVAETTAEP